MPRIKQIPEDFVVREIFEKQRISKDDLNYESKSSYASSEEKGFYVWFTLKKTNWDLFRALKLISRKLGVSIKRFGYAGVKDKRAVTYQKISVWNVPVERLKRMKIKDLELSGFEKAKERVNLGNLKGNKFKITVRDIEKKEKNRMEKNLENVKKKGFLNYFGEQRFGIRNNTHLVGKAIVRNRLKEAVWIYLTHEGNEKEEVEKYRRKLSRTKDLKLGLKECPRLLHNELALLNHLVKNPNDYAGALRKIPKKFRRMFVHAYQSYLWNRLVEVSKELCIPIIGFQTDITKYKTKKQIEKILKSEKITKSDFRIKSMPELSSKGSERERLVKAKGMKWRFEKDEKNENRLKCVLEFEIPRGSYATVLLGGVLK